MPPAGYGPTFPAGERSQTYVLDCAATGTRRMTLIYWANTYVQKENTEAWLLPSNEVGQELNTE
jgi:hypothetical protein